MAAPKRPTHVVTHKNLYLAVKGKLQKQEIGTQLTLSDKQAEKMGAKVASIKEAKTLDLTKDEPEKETKKDK